MRNPSRAALAIVAMLALAACGRSGLEALSGHGPVIPLPAGGIPPLTLDVGDGHDGPLDVTGGPPRTVNPCVVLGSSGTDSVALGSTAGLLPGTRLLLWQVQAPLGLAVGNTNDVLALDTAGRWELARVAAILPESVARLDAPISFPYHSGSGFRAQACVVPEYTEVTLLAGARLSADPWDGSTGGVVAFLSAGTVTIDAASGVYASGDGFRGGDVVVNGSGSGDVTTETTDQTHGGQKGEGLDPASVGQYGKGNLANGAGGGNAENAGGGGGGGGGIGGCGGREFQSFNGSPLLTRGRPGAAVRVPVADRLVPGGGGGAGQQNQNGSHPGGAGGGVVLVFATRIDGSGTLRASGVQPASATQDGGSGGGGGGTILVRAGGGAFDGTISAPGGAGGDASDSNGDTGPGGGGGGGRVQVDGLPSAAIDVSPGAHGLSLKTNVAFFSEDGQPGLSSP